METVSVDWQWADSTSQSHTVDNNNNKTHTAWQSGNVRTSALQLAPLQSTGAADDAGGSWYGEMTTREGQSGVVEDTMDVTWPYLGLMALPLTSVVVHVVIVWMALARRGRSNRPHNRSLLLLMTMIGVDVVYALAVMPVSLTQTMLAGTRWEWRWCGSLLYVQSLLNTATMVHMVVAAWDCLLALLHPLRYQLRSLSVHLTINVLAAWLGAVLLTTPLLVIIILYPVPTPSHHHVTSSRPSCFLYLPRHACLSLFCGFIVPLILLLIPCACVQRTATKQLRDSAQMQLDGTMIHANGSSYGLDKMESVLHPEHSIAMTVSLCHKVAQVGTNGMRNGHLLNKSHVPTEDHEHSNGLAAPDTTKRAAMETLSFTQLLSVDGTAPENVEDDGIETGNEAIENHAHCNGHCLAGLGPDSSCSPMTGRTDGLVIVDVDEVHSGSAHTASSSSPGTTEMKTTPNSPVPEGDTVMPHGLDSHFILVSPNDLMTTTCVKKTRQDLNEPLVNTSHVDLMVEDELDTGNGGSDPADGGPDNGQYDLYDTEDETPLATMIKVCNGDDIPGCRLTITDDERSSSMTSSPDPSDQRRILPQRSILRRGGTNRSTARKNVQFSNTVSTKEIKSLDEITPASSHKRGIQRQSSVHQTNRVKYIRQNAVQMDNGDIDSATISNGLQSSDLSVISGLGGIRMMENTNIMGYLAQLNRWQGQRLGQRVHRQRSHVRLLLMLLGAFSLLTLPHQLLSIALSLDSISLVSSLPIHLMYSLQWLAHSAHLFCPLIYLLVRCQWQEDPGSWSSAFTR